jgi:hypothetical protein
MPVGFQSLKTSVAGYFPLSSGMPAWKLNFSGNAWDTLMDMLTFNSAPYRGPTPFADIRAWGTVVSDGTTDNHAAFDAAVAGGALEIFIPANTVVIKALIPAGLTVKGEDWTTSVIKSAANPATATLVAGPGVCLYNLNLQGNTANTPTNNRIKIWTNTSDVNANVVSTGEGAFHSVGGKTGVDITPAFFQVITGLGDALNGSSGAAGTGGGNAARFDVYPSGAGGVYIGRHANAPGLQINDLTPTVGAGPTTSPAFAYFSDLMTGGAMFTVNQRTATFTGDVYYLAMDDTGSGTKFTGSILRYLLGGTEKARISNNGSYLTTGTTGFNARAITCSNGATNHNMAGGGAGFIIISGPTAGYALGGLAAPPDGAGMVYIFNNTWQIMTITHQDASSSAANRFYSAAGVDFVCAHGFSMVMAFYTGGQWQLLAPANT